MTKEERKPKACKNCGGEFIPFRSFQKCCDIKCAMELAKKDAVVKRRKEAQRNKRAFYASDRRTQFKKAQTAFNAFIRERDKDKPCISCGRHHEGQYHAGHYRSVGAAPHLRFNQQNVHKQCAPCNNHKSGNAVEYRINLVNRLGVDIVESLEGNNDAKKFSLDEIIAIKDYYRAMLKKIKGVNR